MSREIVQIRDSTNLHFSNRTIVKRLIQFAVALVVVVAVVVFVVILVRCSRCTFRRCRHRSGCPLRCLCRRCFHRSRCLCRRGCFVVLLVAIVIVFMVFAVGVHQASSKERSSCQFAACSPSRHIAGAVRGSSELPAVSGCDQEFGTMRHPSGDQKG